MAETSGPTAQLCQWVGSTRSEDIRKGVRGETVTSFYDQLGGMIACAPLPACRPVEDLAAKLGGVGQCSIVALPPGTSVTNATLANRTIAHRNGGKFRWSTGHRSLCCHYSARGIVCGAASFEDVAESGRIDPHAIISCMAADTIARRSTLMKPRGDWRLNA